MTPAESRAEPSESASDASSDSPSMERFIREAASAPTAEPPADLVGRVVAERYAIVERLGRGGMGIVYRAEDKKLRRVVALKVLPASVVADPERRRRFAREALSASAATHPNIAAVYDAGESDGCFYLAMEHVEGETLRAIVARGPIAAPEALRIARAIARGLARAHEAGVVHRDLKPENVMIGADDVVKLLDFGLAKVLARDDAGETQTEDGRILGTPGYMSPEQARGLSLDARSDVFSFGIVLYEMLTGARPFRGATSLDTMLAVTNERAPSLARYGASIDRVVARCLEKERDRRYANGRELVDALANADGAPRSRWRAPAAAGLAIVAAGAAFVAWRHRTPVPAPAAAASSAPVASGGVAITDHPPPKSSNAEALALYRTALEEQRDASLWRSFMHMCQAAEADPTLAAAQLRCAVHNISLPFNVPTKERFARASAGRASLDARDLALLRILEATVAGEPPDAERIIQRCDEAAAAFPRDAEIAYIRAFVLMLATRFEEARDAFTRGLELDPRSAAMHFGLASTTLKLGLLDDARRHTADCLSLAPSAATCMRIYARIDRTYGDCAALEREARSIISVEDMPISYQYLINALASQGAPPEAIAEVQRQKSDALRRMTSDAATIERADIEDAMQLAIYAGDFARAESLLPAFEPKGSAASSEAANTFSAGIRMALAIETGDEAKAARVAVAFHKRLPAWQPDASHGRGSIAAWLRRAGKLDPAEVARRREAAIREALADVIRSNRPRGEIWVDAYAEPAATRADAEEALAALPRFEPLPPNYTNDNSNWHAPAAIGKVKFLVGRVDEAVPLLRQGLAACAGFDALPYLGYHMLLGEALEAAKDRAGACEAYAVVAKRWANAKPRSVTLEQAKNRMRALGCKPAKQ